MNTATSQFDGHTPGPWMPVNLPFADCRILPTDAYGTVLGGGPIADVLNAKDGSKEANARLIAAAPELLRQRDALAEALRWSLGHLPDTAPDYSEAYTWGLYVARATLASIENGALTVDINQRLKEAADPTTSPERLAELAGDRKVGVRWWVARNPSTPAETLDRLTNDHNWTVELAAKTEALRRRTHPR